MKERKFNLSLFLIPLVFISCTSLKEQDKSSDILAESVLAENTAAGLISASDASVSSEADIRILNGYKEVSALLKGYPGIVTEMRAEGDDITFLVRGQKFYFADGRLLPEEKKDNADKYRSYGFYDYPEKLPSLKEPSAEKLEMIDSFVSARRSVSRDNSFIAAVYNGHSFDEILNEIRYINFLDFRFEVHRSLIPRFRAVEKEILREAESDLDLKLFIDSLEKAGSFNWRRANGSRSRSYHSYGIAVDFSPDSFGKKQVFWDWSRKFYKEWYMIPYSRRWMVNEKFAAAFERQGFVWGGKWFYFDNMHFEYRPEILILSGRDVSELR